MRILGTTIPQTLRRIAFKNNVLYNAISSYDAYELARLKSLTESSGHVLSARDLSRCSELEIVEELEKIQPDVVVIDSTVTQDHQYRHEISEFFELVKTNLPMAKTVWGGRDASALGTNAIRHNPVIDVVLADESDSVLLPLLNRWERQGFNANLNDIHGIIFSKKTGSPVATPKLHTQKLVDLDDLPFHNYDELQLPPDIAPVILSSRGCPFACSFCYRQYRFYRMHSVDYFINHIAFLKRRYGFSKFVIDDENFTLNKERCIQICRAIVRHGLDISFECYSRVAGFDEELAFELRRAGCMLVCFGVESGCDKQLRRMKKGQTAADVHAAAGAARIHGLAVSFHLLVGYPGEDVHSLAETFGIVRKLKPERLSVQTLLIMPGSPLARQCKRDGVIDPEAWLLEDAHFSYEKSFSNDAQKNIRNLLYQCRPTDDEDVSKYGILSAGRSICRCHGVTEREIRWLFESGMRTVSEVAQAVGATTACGSCKDIVRVMLEILSTPTTEGELEP
jgi:anaerobic magnesium-protoporphyrin IX monomethyl ester cyclase